MSLSQELSKMYVDNLLARYSSEDEESLESEYGDGVLTLTDSQEKDGIVVLYDYVEVAEIKTDDPEFHEKINEFASAQLNF